MSSEQFKPIPADDLQPSSAPFTFTLDGVKYTLIDGTERFTTNAELETYTFYQILQRHYAAQFKSLSRKIILPPSTNVISRAGRLRILRAAQYHLEPPPPLSPETALLLNEINDTIARSSNDHLVLPSQVSYGRWFNGDTTVGLAMILYYGWADVPDIPIDTFCQYSLEYTEDGIIIDINDTHTYGERLWAGCSSALQKRLDDAKKNNPSDISALMQIAVQRFFYYKRRYVSTGPGFNMVVKNKIYNYVTQIADSKVPEDVPFPEIEEPDRIEPPDTIVIKWEDFQVVKVTDAQRAQRQDNNKQACLESYRRLFNHLPQDTEITFAELGRPERRTLSRGANFGFITKTKKRGVYILHYPREDEQEVIF